MRTMWNLWRLALTVVGIGFTQACVPAPLLAQQASGTQPRSAVGAALVVRPTYVGSDEMLVRAIPLLQLPSRGMYVGPSAVNPASVAFGVQPIRRRRLTIAVEAGAREGRPSSRGDALAGMDDRGITPLLASSIAYRFGPLEALAGVGQGLNDGAGTIATTRLSLGYRSRRVLAAIGAGVTFANARQMRRDFGVSDAEAARRSRLIASGDPRLRTDDSGAYRPDGGVRSRNATAVAMLTLSDRWSAVTFGGVERLADAAAQSPLVRRRDQRSVGFGVLRRF